MPPALLLTAGLGTRLRPLTFVRAKAAVPIDGEPLVRRIVRWLVGAGVTDLVLNLHHLPATIARVLGDGSDLGSRVRYSWEQPVVLGSAGGPKLAAPIVGAETFFIVNGDTLTDVDLAALLEAHQRSAALVTMALVPNREHLKYGGVRLDATGRVTGFAGRGPSAAGSFHFIGVQAANAAAFAAAPAGEPSNTVGGLYDRLVDSAPGSVRGFVTDSAFWDIGTVADYWATSVAFTAARAAQDRPEAEPGVLRAAEPEDLLRSGPRGRNVRVHPTARVDGSILWDDVEVGPGATLAACIVADGVSVPAGASYRRAVLVPSAHGLSATPF